MGGIIVSSRFGYGPGLPSTAAMQVSILPVEVGGAAKGTMPPGGTVDGVSGGA